MAKQNKTQQPISQEMLQALLKSGKMALAKPDPVAAVEEGMGQMAPVSQKPNLGKLFLEGAKAVLPTALSFIPGVGGVASALAKNVLSTLNDDEWFDEFKASGATFAEILKAYQSEVDADGTKYNRHVLTPSIAEVCCDFNYSEYMTEILPSVLAYVRKKTNNVLQDDQELYGECQLATIRLYAIYYTIRKFEKLALNIPVNMPTIANGVNALDPKSYNQLIGIGDALEGYLKTTSGLPYALASYLRWRYGTTFLSENTGKPGLIVYDPAAYCREDRTVAGVALPEDVSIPWVVNNPMRIQGEISLTNNFISKLTDAIRVEQRIISLCGRASADFHTAYADHAIKWDVEAAHYDEKEFNLRVNMTTPTRLVGPNHRLVLDSRLDPNAALQAVTLSTGREDEFTGRDVERADYLFAIGLDQHFPGGYAAGSVPHTVDDPETGESVQIVEYKPLGCPFFVSDVIYLMNVVGVELPIGNGETENDLDYKKPLHAFTSGSEIAQQADAIGLYGTCADKTFIWVSEWITRMFRTLNGTLDWNGGGVGTNSLTAVTWYADEYYGQHANPYGYTVDYQSIGSDNQNLCYSTGNVTDITPTSQYKWTGCYQVVPEIIAQLCVKNCAQAMQMHNHAYAEAYTTPGKPLNLTVVDTDNLAYDTANISHSQLVTIQTMAMRNLFRGDYKRKAESPTAATKEVVTDIVEEVTK